MTTQLILILIAGIIAIALMVVFALILSKNRGHRFEPTPIMTDNELEFFHRLEKAYPDGYVFPQVSMAAVMRPKAMSGKERLAAFRAISQKRIDFAVYSRTMELLCVVELDDRTHDASRDRIRDTMLSTAGIRTIRWESRQKPDIGTIRKSFQALA
jgi:hypothetical protein